MNKRTTGRYASGGIRGKLTDKAVKAFVAKSKPGKKLADGGGLHLFITPAGGTAWRLTSDTLYLLLMLTFKFRAFIKVRVRSRPISTPSARRFSIIVRLRKLSLEAANNAFMRRLSEGSRPSAVLPITRKLIPLSINRKLLRQ
jgi:hypothetical protein